MSNGRRMRRQMGSSAGSGGVGPTYAAREISDEDLDAALGAALALTDRAVRSFGGGVGFDMDEAGLNERLHAFGERFGAAGLLAGFLAAAVRLAGHILQHVGAADGIVELVKDVPTLHRGARRTAGLRLLEGVLAEPSWLFRVAATLAQAAGGFGRPDV